MIFNGFCKQTSTGLWSGITEKPKYNEQELRGFILNYAAYAEDEEEAKKFERLNYRSKVLSYFTYQVLSLDFVRELVEKLEEDWREHLENCQISLALLVKNDVPQAQIINSITYVKGGLVKYNKELNSIIRKNKE